MYSLLNTYQFACTTVELGNLKQSHCKSEIARRYSWVPADFSVLRQYSRLSLQLTTCHVPQWPHSLQVPYHPPALFPLPTSSGRDTQKCGTHSQRFHFSSFLGLAAPPTCLATPSHWTHLDPFLTTLSQPFCSSFYLPPVCEDCPRSKLTRMHVCLWPLTSLPFLLSGTPILDTQDRPFKENMKLLKQ